MRGRAWDALPIVFCWALHSPWWPASGSDAAGACAGQAAAAPGTDKDFWNRALKTPLSNDSKPASSGKSAYPELYRGGETGSVPVHAAYVSVLHACLERIRNGNDTQQNLAGPYQAL